MSNIRKELIQAAISRAFALIDYNAHNGFHEGHEFMQQTILTDNSLTEEEKTEAIRLNNKNYDREKIIYNDGKRRVCENSDWIDGKYEEWDSKEQQLIRYGTYAVILKELKNVENASQSWFEEAKSHLTLGNKLSEIVQCFAPEVINGKGPDINTLCNKMNEIKSYYRNNPNELPQSIIKVDKKTSNIMSSKIFTSKIHNFDNLPEPKNATEEEQKAFYITRSYDFSISSNDNDSKESSRLFKKLKMENDDVQKDYEREIMQQRSNISINDEVQNNPNLHSEQKDKQEIPDDGF
ncbi:kinase-like domain-containing protein [Rhizophagus irregularis DAOM 181602=DAOM 197198]|nr:kinase-like domain-containing protein [Rhizophagus irregularis DAOM 181602=DAOM 197198]